MKPAFPRLAVSVRHLDRNVTAECSEHENLVRNKAEAVMALRQKVKGESVFNEIEMRLDDSANKE